MPLKFRLASCSYPKKLDGCGLWALYTVNKQGTSRPWCDASPIRQEAAVVRYLGIHRLYMKPDCWCCTLLGKPVRPVVNYPPQPQATTGSLLIPGWLRLLKVVARDTCAQTVITHEACSSAPADLQQLKIMSVSHHQEHYTHEASCRLTASKWDCSW